MEVFMQNTNNLKAKEGKLTLIAFLTFLWNAFLILMPDICYDFYDKSFSNNKPFFLHFLEFLKERDFTSPVFIISLLLIIIPLFLFLVTLVAKNPFTKRKILDLFVFISTLLFFYCLFAFIYNLIIPDSVFYLIPLFCSLYIGVSIAYLFIRKPFVKKKTKSNKKSFDEKESGIFINVYMHK